MSDLPIWALIIFWVLVGALGTYIGAHLWGLDRQLRARRELPRVAVHVWSEQLIDYRKARLSPFLTVGLTTLPRISKERVEKQIQRTLEGFDPRTPEHKQFREDIAVSRLVHPLFRLGHQKVGVASVWVLRLVVWNVTRNQRLPAGTEVVHVSTDLNSADVLGWRRHVCDSEVDHAFGVQLQADLAPQSAVRDELTFVQTWGGTEPQMRLTARDGGCRVRVKPYPPARSGELGLLHRVWRRLRHSYRPKAVL